MWSWKGNKRWFKSEILAMEREKEGIFCKVVIEGEEKWIKKEFLIKGTKMENWIEEELVFSESKKEIGIVKYNTKRRIEMREGEKKLKEGRETKECMRVWEGGAGEREGVTST